MLLFQKTSKNYSNHIIFTTFSHKTYKI